MERVIRRDEAVDRGQINLDETIFGNANGYIGVRGALEEGVPDGWNTMRGMYVNGTYEIIPMKQAEMLCNFVDRKQTMLNCADTMTIYLIINGERFSLTEGTVLSNERVLDMDSGYTAREIVWRSPSGKEVKILIRRMTSFLQTSLFLIEYYVTAQNFDGEVRFESWHIADVTNYSNPDDPRLAAESEAYLHVDVMTDDGSVSTAVATTHTSHISVCSSVHNRLESPNDVEEERNISGTRSEVVLTTHLHKSETAKLIKYTVFSDSIRQRDVRARAASEMQQALSTPVAKFYREQRQYLDAFWQQSAMEIRGDDDLNAAVAFNMYELLCSAPGDRYCSIAAKGLSGEGYEGHYFWDAEMFVAPFFILTNPNLARTVLSFRYTTLDKARENARLLGHKKGALYPWRTITGVECSGYFVSGSAAYHINGDIAYAIIQYYLTTGDDDFMLDKGCEMLLETARLWLETGNFVDGRFVINDVTGPDEYTCMVDNNYYTNSVAKYNLEWAVDLTEKYADRKEMQELLARLHITSSELDEMRRAASQMFLPYDEKRDINPQDDSFLSKPLWDLAATPKEDFPLLLHYHPLCLYRHQVCKQADTVQAYFLFEDAAQKHTMVNSFRYYEKITTHDSSLSTCVFSIVASRLGLKEEAFKYFGDSAKLDLLNTHNNTKDGVHTANMGGCYMAIVNGFAGLRITKEGLRLAPYVPEGWEGYSFTFLYQDRRIRVDVNGGHTTVTLLEGGEIPLRLYDTDKVLVPDMPLEVG